MPIPPGYDDYCTGPYPNRWGRVWHGHDVAYWWGRDPLAKIWADYCWLGGILWTHRFNVLWWPVLIPWTLAGDAALWTWGWWLWARRHRHGPRDWRNA